MCEKLIELQQVEYEAVSNGQYRAEFLSDPEFSIWNLTDSQRWKAYTPETQTAINAARDAIKAHVLACSICKVERPEMFVLYGGDLGVRRNLKLP